MPYDPINRATANTTAIVAPLDAGPATSGWRSFLQLQTEVTRRMGGRADLATADVQLHINEAYVDLCSMLDFEFLKTSVSWSSVVSQPFYALTRAFREVITLSSVDTTDTMVQQPLEKLDLQTFRRLLAYSTDVEAMPEFFTLSPDNVIALYPAPDVAYTLSMDVKLRPALLTASTDYSILPDEWIEALTILSISKALSGLNEFEMAAQRYNEYLGMVRSRRNERAERAEGTHGRVWIPRSAEELKRGTRRA